MPLKNILRLIKLLIGNVITTTLNSTNKIPGNNNAQEYFKRFKIDFTVDILCN